jgi:hypothetical protein
MSSGSSVDELSGNPDTIRLLAQTAFEHTAHTEFAADLLYINGSTLVRECGITR